MGTMQSVVFFLAILGVLATVMTLFNGVLSMTEEHHPDPHHGEKLMFQRVGIQAVTVALVVAALLI
jgi:hypothetical protein